MARSKRKEPGGEGGGGGGGDAERSERKAKRKERKKGDNAKEAKVDAAPAAEAGVVPPGSRAVQVENLPFGVTQDEVRALFPRATKVFQQQFKARVCFLEAGDVAAAVKMDGAECRGRPVKVRAEAAEAVEEVAAGYEIFLKYLPYSATEEELKGWFEACGRILGDVRLMRDPGTGKCKGIGWITFAEEEGRREALGWDGFAYGGRHVSVTPATTSALGVRGTTQAIGTHTPAMVDEVLRAIVLPDPDGTYVDGTFGRGGHSRAILSRLSPRGRLHAFDLDPEAIKEGRRLEAEDSRFKIHHAPFGDLAETLREAGASPPSGVFLDLGISSPQFDEAHRGFRPEADGPLDLRFDQTRGESAHELLGHIGRDELATLLVEGGEADAHAARRIADAVVLARSAGALPGRTRAFAELVAAAKGKEYQAMHPAKLTFQALRIHLNQELEEMRRGMFGALEAMAEGGRLGLLTWKHTECAEVVRFLRGHEAAREEMPTLKWMRQERPAELEAIASADCLSMDDVARPTQREVAENSRSRSALLHVLRKRRGLRAYDLERAAYGALGWGEPPEPPAAPPPRAW